MTRTQQRRLENDVREIWSDCQRRSRWEAALEEQMYDLDDKLDTILAKIEGLSKGRPRSHSFTYHSRSQSRTRSRAGSRTPMTCTERESTPPIQTTQMDTAPLLSLEARLTDGGSIRPDDVEDAVSFGDPNTSPPSRAGTPMAVEPTPTDDKSVVPLSSRLAAVESIPKDDKPVVSLNSRLTRSPSRMDAEPTATAQTAPKPTTELPFVGKNRRGNLYLHGQTAGSRFTWDEWKKVHPEVPQKFKPLKVFLDNRMFSTEDIDDYLDRVYLVSHRYSRDAFSQLKAAHAEAVKYPRTVLCQYLLDNFDPNDRKYDVLAQRSVTIRSTALPDLAGIPNWTTDSMHSWIKYLYNTQNPFIHFRLPPKTSSVPLLTGSAFEALHGILTLGSLMPKGFRLAALEYAHQALSGMISELNELMTPPTVRRSQLQASEYTALTPDIIKDYLIATPFSKAEVASFRAWILEDWIRK